MRYKEWAGFYPGFTTCKMLQMFAALAFGRFVAAAAIADEGYELLFTSFTEEIPRSCHGFSPVLSTLGLTGTFIIPSVSQFELGDNAFQSVLDGYGKLHKFDFDSTRNEICYTSRMIESGFYNESQSANRIAPGILFMNTVPPLDYNAAQKIAGPNDNSYVNTFHLGSDSGSILSLTDSQYMLKIQLESLSGASNVKFDDKLDKSKLSTGSAHVLARGDCMVDIDPQSDMDGTKAKVLLFQMCPNAEGTFTRTVINSYNTSDGFLPYMHSFGLTQNYAILPHQSFFFDYNKVVIGGKPLVEAMIDNPTASSFDLKILPLDGSNVYTVTIDQGEPFYYFHIINSHENDASDAVVLDLSCLSINMLPYFTLEMERTKQIRDNSTFGAVIVKRYTVYFRGPNAGKWAQETLSDPRRSTDFPNFNRALQGRPNCFFYAIQWFHDYETYADMAILKKDSCSGKELYWHQDNFFPSEPTFVAAKSPEGGEDEGILLFTAVHGATKSSYLVVCDAKTMQTIDMVPVPGIVTFTTHGEWYPKVSGGKEL